MRIAAVLEDDTEVNIAEDDSPAIFQLVDEWQVTTPRTLREIAAEQNLREAIQQYAEDAGHESLLADYSILD